MSVVPLMIRHTVCGAGIDSADLVCDFVHPFRHLLHSCEFLIIILDCRFGEADSLLGESPVGVWNVYLRDSVVYLAGDVVKGRHLNPLPLVQRVCETSHLLCPTLIERYSHSCCKVLHELVSGEDDIPTRQDASCQPYARDVSRLA
ncbi:hypothetical protein KQY30_15360 [Streptomyces sp. GMY02]|uniref:hypothetical protein n=1 Tax=Streptomyces sp. GMY02 TaxID=1333528 RepID=UPI001C2C549C|nr:hypothetical protein [Streptomyces sp. GMY02]QXE35434.1 hypothetical protein KQY30_15360 [Streptomyces sp. GMY02]